MDINLVRSIVTVVVMFGFLTVTFWAFSPRKKNVLNNDAANIPFADDEEHNATVRGKSDHE